MKLFKIKSLSRKRIRRQDTDWKNLFAKDKSDKGLLCKMYKERLQTWQREM